MDGIYRILNNINQILSTKSYAKIKAGDYVRNINKSCIHYGSEGIVEKTQPIENDIGHIVSYKTTNAGTNWTNGEILQKTEDQLAVLDDTMKTLLADDHESETPESELEEYKEDFYEMSVGSLKAIYTHAHHILNSLDMPQVKENLTESWLQGKIAVTEDYMRTIHDFIMYVSEAADTISAEDRPGLWENIRKKREREGKKYKPAKPGDKDRPDPEQWKKLTKP